MSRSGTRKEIGGEGRSLNEAEALSPHQALVLRNWGFFIGARRLRSPEFDLIERAQENPEVTPFVVGDEG